MNLSHIAHYARTADEINTFCLLVAIERAMASTAANEAASDGSTSANTAYPPNAEFKWSFSLRLIKNSAPPWYWSWGLLAY